MTINSPIDNDALDQLFREARSFSYWLDRPVSDEQIAQIYELVKMAPTSGNQQPGRFVWCRSPEAKAKLASCAAEGNQKKILSAPVTVIIGYDLDFHEQLDWLFPHSNAKSWFTSEEALQESAFRNATLQSAYLIMAARSLGLDCGPMSGFDQEAATKAFFNDEPRFRADLICSIGYGDHTRLHDRLPRPEFDSFNTLA